ncbi:MAG: hypothetical protein ACR2N3_09325 [Pyrinomonadaceae bacterium]
MEEKKLKKELAKIPDVDKNGDPIYKIDKEKTADNQSKDKPRNTKNRDSK